MILDTPYFKELNTTPPFYSSAFNAWIFSHPEHIRELIKSPLISAQRSLSYKTRFPPELEGRLIKLQSFRNNMLFFMEGNKHELMRSKTASLLSNRYQEVSRKLPNIWKNSWEKTFTNKKTEVVSELVIPSVKQTMEALLGCPQEITSQLQNWSESFSKSMSGIPNKSYLLEAENSFLEAENILKDNTNKPWVNTFFNSSNSSFSEEEKIQTLLLFFFAGFDTSLSMLSNAIFSIAMEDFPLAPNCELSDTTKTIIARTCPVNFTMREVLSNFKYENCDIKQGDRILISWIGGNLQSSTDNVDITGKFAFGIGVHSCIGKAIAIAQLKSCLSEFSNLNKKILITNNYSFNNNMCFHYPNKFEIEWHDLMK